MRNIILLILLSTIALSLNITYYNIWKTGKWRFHAEISFDDSPRLGNSSYNAYVELKNSSSRNFSLQIYGNGPFNASGDFEFNGTGSYEVRFIVNTSTVTNSTNWELGRITFPIHEDVHYSFNISISQNPDEDIIYHGINSGIGESYGIGGSCWNFTCFYLIGDGNVSTRKDQGYPARFEISSNRFVVGLSDTEWESVYSKRDSWKQYSSRFGTADSGILYGGLFWEDGIGFVHCSKGFRTLSIEKLNGKLMIRCW